MFDDYTSDNASDEEPETYIDIYPQEWEIVKDEMKEQDDE